MQTVVGVGGAMADDYQEEEGDELQMAKEVAIAQFAERFPIDDIAKARLRALPDEALQRVFNDFRPATDPHPDFSRRLMGFLKGFHHVGAPPMLMGGGGGPGLGRGASPPRREAGSSAKFVAFNPALTSFAQWPELSLSALTQAVLASVAAGATGVTSGGTASMGSTAPLTLQADDPPVPEEQLELFRLQFPMDQSAFDYLRIAPPAVQQRVINTFRPPETAHAQGEYSRIVTAHITFCMNRHREQAGQVARGGPSTVSVEEACAAIMGHAADGMSASSSAKYIPEENLEMFRQSYPMDERAFDYLRSAPGDVQERVITTFRVDRVQTDYSRAITAHVRFCLKRHREVTSAPVALPSGADGAATMAMIAEFRQKFPIDERALNYILQSSVEVKHRVLTEFRPAPGLDGDYSRAVTAFVRRCREDEKNRQHSSSASAITSAASSLGLWGLTASQQAQAQAVLTNALALAGVDDQLAKRLRTQSGAGVQPGFGTASISPITGTLPGGIMVRGPKPASLRPLSASLR